MSTTEYFEARYQESSHAAYAAMRAFGIPLDLETIKETATRASGEYSHLTILDCLGEFFRAANVTKDTTR